MAVAPMNAHFLWWNGTNLQETHINDILNNIDSIPAGVANGFLILVLRYCDPDTLVEYDNPKLGHYIAGHDNYYVNLIGNPIDTVEYAIWDDPTTGQTRVTLHQLRGQSVETKAFDVRVNTLSNSRKYVGVLVSDALYTEALAMAADF